MATAVKRILKSFCVVPVIVFTSKTLFANYNLRHALQQQSAVSLKEKA